MGGRGSSSGGGGGGAAKLLSKSAKEVTKGLTKSKLDKLSRKQLETLGIFLAAKNMMKTMKLTASEALHRAESLAPHNTNAQIKKTIWKLRNID